MIGLLGIGCALALPFAPVMVDHATVTWPKAGSGPQSTTALFVPYKPNEFKAQVPCSVLRTALDQRRRLVVFATAGDAGARPTPGVAVIADGGRIRVTVAGRHVTDSVPGVHGAQGAPGGADCGISIAANAAATTVTIGAASPIRLAGVVPEVHAFVTDLGPNQATGLSATAQARNLFEAAPSTLKLALIAAQVALALLSILLLVQVGRANLGRTGSPRAPRARARPTFVILLIDGTVIALLGIWAVIGPSSADDGYALMTIRNAAHSGDIGNYYHWFSASEAPFTTVQWLLRPLVEISIVPVWLRLPSTLAGIVTWFLISRGIVGRLLPRTTGSRPIRLLTAVVFLAWWLPYNLGIRPEPFIALTIAATFTLLLAATAPGARAGGLPQLGAAALTAGLAVSITPSGIVVLAPILVMAPRVWRTLTADLRAGVSGGFARSTVIVGGRLTLLGCLMSVGMIAIFARQSWHGVQVATEIHKRIGPSLHWYQELTRYGFLLGLPTEGNMSNPAKRIVVLLAIVLLVAVAILISRNVRALTGLQELHLVTGAAALSLLLLWATPSKWSHHFGGLVATGVPFLVAALIALTAVARSAVIRDPASDRASGDGSRETARDRMVPVLGLVAGGGVALAAGLAFSGQNKWWAHTNFGVPWTDEKIQPLGLPFHNPVFWIVVAGASAVIFARARRPAGANASGDARVVAVLLPVHMTAMALGASVLILLGSFIAAPLSQGAGYSVAGENIAHLGSKACGIADKVQVMPDVQGGTLRVAERPRTGPAGGSAEVLEGFVAGRGHLPNRPPEDRPGTARSRYLWGSFAPNELTTGTLVSPWFTLPKLTPAQELTVSVAGRIDRANSVRFEFTRAGSGTVSAGPPLRSKEQAGWRAVGMPSGEIPPDADRVRIRAVDRSVDVGGWLAVTGPRLSKVVSLTRFLDGRGPVLIDWQIALSAPCASSFPVVAHGLARAPAVWITAFPPENGQALRSLAAAPGQGGSFAGVRWAGSVVEVPSRLADGSGQVWGHVLLARYPMAMDAYDVRISSVRSNGWQGDE